MFALESYRRDLTAVAKDVLADWSRRPKPDGIWSKHKDLALDLSNPQGRFGLLIYAILSGARVRPSHLRRTFLELQEAHLVDSARLALGSELDKETVLGIFESRYRALTQYERKAEALLAVGKKVETEYAGDIGRLYSLCAGRAGEVLSAIRGFPGIDHQAYWFCREMKLEGIWPDLDNSACLAVDNEIKFPLWYLGFVGRGSYFIRDVSAEECLEAIQIYFAGDPLPLLYKSRSLCQYGDSQLCQQACSSSEECQVRFLKSAGCF